MSAGKILDLLQSPTPTETKVEEDLSILAVALQEVNFLSELNALLEQSLLRCAIFIFLEPESAFTKSYQSQLYCLLGAENYQFLVILIAWVRTCHIWMEAHPEVSYEADRRVIEHLEPLLAEEPRLANFFRHYREQIKWEQKSLVPQLAQISESQQAAKTIPPLCTSSDRTSGRIGTA